LFKIAVDGLSFRSNFVSHSFVRHAIVNSYSTAS